MPGGLLLYFLLEIGKERRIEEILNGDIQTITQILDRGYCGIVSAANNIIDCRLRYAADRAELVDGQISLCTVPEYVPVQLRLWS